MRSGLRPVLRRGRALRQRGGERVTGELGVGTVLAEPLLTNLLSRLSSKKLFQLGGSSVPLSLAAEKRPLTTGLPFCTKGRLVQDGLFVTATPFLAFIV
jgi:hypothetical protein